MLARAIALGTMGMLALTTALAAQNQPPANEPTISLALTPTTVRAAQPFNATVRLRNPRQNQQIPLQATATYTDANGQQQTVRSNTVTLVVDYSLPVRVTLPADVVRLVAGTARFDGVPIQPVSPTTIQFDVVLPADGRDHVLELEVVR